MFIYIHISILMHGTILIQLKHFLKVIYMYLKRLFYMYMLIEIFLCNLLVVIVLQNVPQLGGWVVIAIFEFADEMM